MLFVSTLYVQPIEHLFGATVSTEHQGCHLHPPGDGPRTKDRDVIQWLGLLQPHAKISRLVPLLGVNDCKSSEIRAERWAALLTNRIRGVALLTHRLRDVAF